MSEQSEGRSEQGEGRSEQFAVNSMVRLIVPENIRLHGALGIIRKLTEWGAFVDTLAAATGQFRAIYEEMVPEHIGMNGSGYSGSVCDKCGSTRMRRAGSCELCDDCGEQGSCG